MSNEFNEVVEDMILYFYRHKYLDTKREMIKRKILYLLCIVCPDEETLEENIKRFKHEK